MLNGKIALLTGANGGIGKSTLELFVKKGAKVICLIRKPDKKFIKYIKKFNNKVIVIVSDITNENNLKSEIEKAFTKINKLDILINCAGITIQSAENYQLDDWQKTLNINLTAPFLMIKNLIFLMFFVPLYHEI